MNEKTVTIGVAPDVIAFKLHEVEMQYYPSVEFYVSVAANGFTGSAFAYFTTRAVDEFLEQLEKLDRTRQGEAKLAPMSDPSEYAKVHFKLFALDKLGHIAANIELVKIEYLSGTNTHRSKLDTVFEIDAGSLGTIRDGFEQLRHFWI